MNSSRSSDPNSNRFRLTDTSKNNMEGPEHSGLLCLEVSLNSEQQNLLVKIKVLVFCWSNTMT